MGKLEKFFIFVLLMETLNSIIQIWLLNHVSPPAISTFILIDQAILNQLNQSDTAATVPEKMFFASTYWPIWNASYDQVDSIKIVDNPDKSYLIFDLPNESRAIKRFPTNSTNVQLKNGADVELLFPSNVDEFMWRWNNGRFLLCHIEEGRKTTYHAKFSSVPFFTSLEQEVYNTDEWVCDKVPSNAEEQESYEAGWLIKLNLRFINLCYSSGDGKKHIISSNFWLIYVFVGIYLLFKRV